MLFPGNIVQNHRLIVACALEGNAFCDGKGGRPTGSSGWNYYGIAFVSRANSRGDVSKRNAFGRNGGGSCLATNSHEYARHHARYLQQPAAPSIYRYRLPSPRDHAFSVFLASCVATPREYEPVFTDREPHPGNKPTPSPLPIPWSRTMAPWRRIEDSDT